MSRTERVQAAIRTHGVHLSHSAAAEVVKAVVNAPKEFDKAKADQKTAEEAIENAVAGLGTIAAVGVTAGIGHIVELDSDSKAVIMVGVSTGVMGILKTVIRRVRNRRKHRKEKGGFESGRVV